MESTLTGVAMRYGFGAIGVALLLVGSNSVHAQVPSAEQRKIESEATDRETECIRQYDRDHHISSGPIPEECSKIYRDAEAQIGSQSELQGGPPPSIFFQYEGKWIIGMDVDSNVIAIYGQQFLGKLIEDPETIFVEIKTDKSGRRIGYTAGYAIACVMAPGTPSVVGLGPGGPISVSGQAIKITQTTLENSMGTGQVNTLVLSGCHVGPAADAADLYRQSQR
jgi:hypothetical protein